MSAFATPARNGAPAVKAAVARQITSARAIGRKDRDISILVLTHYIYLLAPSTIGAYDCLRLRYGYSSQSPLPGDAPARSAASPTAGQEDPPHRLDPGRCGRSVF